MTFSPYPGVVHVSCSSYNLGVGPFWDKEYKEILPLQIWENRPTKRTQGKCQQLHSKSVLSFTIRALMCHVDEWVYTCIIGLENFVQYHYDNRRREGWGAVSGICRGEESIVKVQDWRRTDLWQTCDVSIISTYTLNVFP